jgi:hypothetical protein
LDGLLRVVAVPHEDFALARDRLDEWEHNYGEVPECSSLRTQLDRLPPELFERGGKREDD